MTCEKKSVWYSFVSTSFDHDCSTPEWDASPSEVTPHWPDFLSGFPNNSLVPIYTPRCERKCLIQEHKTVSPARSRTRNTRHTNRTNHTSHKNWNTKCTPYQYSTAILCREIHTRNVCSCTSVALTPDTTAVPALGGCPPDDTHFHWLRPQMAEWWETKMLPGTLSWSLLKRSRVSLCLTQVSKSFFQMRCQLGIATGQ